MLMIVLCLSDAEPLPIHTGILSLTHISENAKDVTSEYATLWTDCAHCF